MLLQHTWPFPCSTCILEIAFFTTGTPWIKHNRSSSVSSSSENHKPSPTADSHIVVCDMKWNARCWWIVHRNHKRASNIGPIYGTVGKMSGMLLYVQTSTVHNARKSLFTKRSRSLESMLEELYIKVSWYEVGVWSHDKMQPIQQNWDGILLKVPTSLIRPWCQSKCNVLLTKPY